MPKSKWAASILAAAAVVPCGNAPAATRHLDERVLTAPVILLARPAASARHLVTLAHHQRDGAPTLVLVQRHVTIRGIHWLHVDTPVREGWITVRHTRSAARLALSAALSRRLGHLLDSAGPASGAIISDRAGAVLWQRRAGARRTLASNTKVFATALFAHVARWAALTRLRSILLPSDNALAEELSRQLGGARAAMRYAARYGAHPSLYDGSGLDYRDQDSAADIARFLAGEATDRGFAVWKASLPTAGRSGTLADRMVGGAAAGRCHAKTGTLPIGPVTALSGYCKTRSRRQLIFSILMTRTSSISFARATQDRMVNALAARG